MHLFEVSPIEHQLVHVVARNVQEAVDIFVTWSAAHGRVHESFTVDRLPVDSLKPDQRAQVHSAIEAGLVGIAHFDEVIGWTFSPPLWQASRIPRASGDHERRECLVMRIFQMRDLNEIEAFVLAPDYDRASALFEQHLRTHGGDPDATLYRELELQHLDEPANDAVYEALDLDREGLVTCDTAGQWAFVTPLGVRNAVENEQ